MVSRNMSLWVIYNYDRFLAGGVPFGEDCTDPYEIYELIQIGDKVYPEYVKDKNAKKLID